MKLAIFRLVGLIAFLAVVMLNVEVYVEYYGDGPPYFNRTTNMDKWSNPVPIICMIDGVFLIAGWMVRRLVKKCPSET